MKVVRFHVRKIEEVYGQFMQWRKKYGRVLIFGLIVSVAAEVLWLVGIKGKFYILALANFLFILSTYFVFAHNRSIIEASNFRNYSQKQQQIFTDEIELNDHIERKNVEKML